MKITPVVALAVLIIAGFVKLAVAQPVSPQLRAAYDAGYAQGRRDCPGINFRESPGAVLFKGLVGTTSSGYWIFGSPKNIKLSSGYTVDRKEIIGQMFEETLLKSSVSVGRIQPGNITDKRGVLFNQNDILFGNIQLSIGGDGSTVAKFVAASNVNEAEGFRRMITEHSRLKGLGVSSGLVVESFDLPK